MAFSYPETSFDRISFVHNSKAMPAIVYLDAIKIETGTTECITPMRADMSGDCKVDMKDFVEFASSWLMSNLYPED
jgi:hypothetical protein